MKVSMISIYNAMGIIFRQKDFNYMLEIDISRYNSL